MSVASVKAWCAQHAPDIEVIETTASTATVVEAAAAHGVAPGQIAKTLALRVDGGEPFLVVARGDARLDNRKIKVVFDGKARMLGRDEVEGITGHPVGGVCPFGVEPGLKIYCDESIRPYAEVLPAAGSPNSAVRIPPERLAQLVDAQWIDICKLPETL